MNTAQISSSCVSPAFPTTETCRPLQTELVEENTISLQHRHHANPLPLKENVWVEPINVTVSPPYCDLLEQSSPNSSVLKTSPDCYQQPQNQEKNPVHISNRCSGSFMRAGTMRSGLLSEHRSLKLTGQEKGSYSLPRPGALSWSGKGRPPGTTKSEAKAKKLGLIGKKEVFNPEWLEVQFGLPVGWTSPQEHRAATELIAPVAPPSEISSTPELLRSPSSGYYTSTPSAKSVKESSGKYSSKSKRKKPKSSDCWYTPPHIVELVVQVLGQIDLDPCADDGKHIPAQFHYTATDDGLEREWKERVFMNPPYSCPGKWMKKLIEEFAARRVKEAIALVPAATDTNWLSPVLKSQPVCFWKGRIKFLGEDYQPKSSARQSHVLVYWGNSPQKFQEVFEAYGYVPPQPHNDPLLGDNKNSPSNSSSKVNFSPSKRQRGFGNGYIYWRTITKKGKDYPQAYYHWKDNGKKRSKYIPKRLLGVIQEAENQKRPVIEILELLGVGVSPSNLLGDAENSPSNNRAYVDIEDNPDKLLGDKQANNVESIETTFFEDSPSNSPSKVDFSPSKRRKGDGSGSIHWRTIIRGGKDYPQAYYHYEFWKDGDRLIKSSKYISKRLLSQVQQLELEKAPVREILQVLGVKL